MGRALQRAWLHRGLWAYLVLDLSVAYGLLVRLRRRWYRSGLLASQRMPVPVVVVGNVVAGGAGKTPLVMALLEHLRGRGMQAGVVSRGYGRRATDVREVTGDSLAGDVGDEPLLIHQTCDVPVFVAPRRGEAARALLAAHPSVQVVVCDDGLQHLALQRDIELCLFDERGIGNGWLLPAGPLREPWPREVDFVLSSGAPEGIGGFAVQRALAPFARNGRGERIELAQLQGRPLVAVAGIASPEAFFTMLRSQGLTLAQTVPLPDHYDFNSTMPALGKDSSLVCTEKDAMKLWRSQPDAWAVALRVSIDAAFWPAFDALLDAKLSSGHGPQTS